MKMRQETIWKRYLIFGIKLPILFILGCGECDDCNIQSLEVEIIYYNNTESKIGYNLSCVDTTLHLFEIEPFGSHIINTQGIRDTTKEIDKDCCEGVFESLQERFSNVLLIFNDEKCLLFESGNGPTTQNFSNYEFEKLSEGSVRYTYTFTEEDRMKATSCN